MRLPSRDKGKFAFNLDLIGIFFISSKVPIENHVNEVNCMHAQRAS